MGLGWAGVGLGQERYQIKFDGDRLLDTAGNWVNVESGAELGSFAGLEAGAELCTYAVSQQGNAMRDFRIAADGAEIAAGKFYFGFCNLDLEGKTLTLNGSLFAGQSGAMMEVRNGTLNAPNSPVGLGEYPGHNGTLTVDGAGTVMNVKGVKIPQGNATNPSKLFVTNGATMNLLGGKIEVSGPGKEFRFIDATVTNFTGFVAGEENRWSTWGQKIYITNSVVECNSNFWDMFGDSNTVVVAGGAKVNAGKLRMVTNESRVEITGAGTEFLDAYWNYNGALGICGSNNLVTVSDGARLYTTGETIRCDIAVGSCRINWNDTCGNMLLVKDGGTLEARNAKIYIGENLMNSAEYATTNNVLRVEGVDGKTGKPSVAIAAQGLEIGGGYNNQGSKYAGISENRLEVAAGGIVSNLNGTAFLPRAGWGNRTLVDGGTLYSKGGISIGHVGWGFCATNNAVRIHGGGKVVTEGTCLLYGGLNRVELIDGLMELGSNLNSDSGTDRNSFAIGMKGRLRADGVWFGGATPGFTVVLGEELPNEPLIETVNDVYFNEETEFAAENLERVCNRAHGDVVVANARRIAIAAATMERWTQELDAVAPGTRIYARGASGGRQELVLHIRKKGMLILVK